MPTPGIEARIPVTLSSGGTAKASCRLTMPRTGTAAWNVVIGIPGATRDGSYYECPEPSYSLAARMTQAGLAFLAVDRLGTGRSDPLPAAEASMEADGAAAAAVVEWARRQFGCVVLYGEGLGAMIATCAAARLADAGAAQPDLLVLAGAAHSPAGRLDPALLAPASRDFPGAGEGWVVARDADQRHRLLHGPGAAPAVLAEDPGTILSIRQFVEAQGWIVTSPGQGPCAQVTAPVLLIAGERDPLVATAADGDAALEAAERPHYPRAAAFTAEVIPGAPHSLALSSFAYLSFGVIALTLLDVQMRALPAYISAP